MSPDSKTSFNPYLLIHKLTVREVFPKIVKNGFARSTQFIEIGSQDFKFMLYLFGLIN